MTIDYEKRGNVAIITINRPEAKNAVNGDVARGIESAIDQMEADQEIWVGILTHAGDVFCAGADLKAINAGQAGDLATKNGGFAGFVQRERTKPVIVAANGPAFAGGCEIVLAADMLVGTPETRVGVPEVKRCLVAAAGATFRLLRKLPRNVALEMLLTGDPIDAERAYALGLMNRIAPSGQALDVALELAAQITANAPVAVRETRRAAIEGVDADDATAWKLAAEAMGKAMSSPDVQEGLMAFIEKRAPQWSGA